jgi:hypothetical protein
MRTYAFCLLVFLFYGCNEDDFCCIDPENEIVDTWILFERGYSPGSGYYVDPVSETPPQTMQVSSDGRFSSNIVGLEHYRYFAILQDQDWEILALFENKPPKDPDVDNLEHSYLIEFQENGTVKLYFRYCIEGCHLGLRRISN